jgi:hypothetical protein
MDVLNTLSLFTKHGNFSQLNLVVACTLHIIDFLQNLGLGILSLLTISVVARLVMLE